MDETKNQIMAVLDANAGVCSWDAILAGVPPQNHRYINEAMSSLEAANQAKRVTRYDATLATGVFEVQKVVA